MHGAGTGVSEGGEKEGEEDKDGMMNTMFILSVLALIHHRAEPATTGEIPTVEPISYKPQTMNELRIEYGLLPVEHAINGEEEQ